MEPKSREEIYYRRFGPLEIGLHISVVVSFLGLALTGLILKYSGASWAKVLAALLGGVPAAGAFHRFFALVTFGYLFTHLYDLGKRYRVEHRRQRGVLRIGHSDSPGSSASVP